MNLSLKATDANLIVRHPQSGHDVGDEADAIGRGGSIPPVDRPGEALPGFALRSRLGCPRKERSTHRERLDRPALLCGKRRAPSPVVPGGSEQLRAFATQTRASGRRTEPVWSRRTRFGAGDSAGDGGVVPYKRRWTDLSDRTRRLIILEQLSRAPSDRGPHRHQATACWRNPRIKGQMGGGGSARQLGGGGPHRLLCLWTAEPRPSS